MTTDWAAEWNDLARSFNRLRKFAIGFLVFNIVIVVAWVTVAVVFGFWTMLIWATLHGFYAYLAVGMIEDNTNSRDDCLERARAAADRGW